MKVKIVKMVFLFVLMNLVILFIVIFFMWLNLVLYFNGYRMINLEFNLVKI